MAEMNPSEAKAYLERWALLEKAELVELRRTSMDLKLRQLAVDGITQPLWN